MAVIVGLVFGGVYGCYVMFRSSSDQVGDHVSTGAVSSPHASFEQECNQCHQDFTPLDPHAPVDWMPLFDVDESESRNHLEMACQKCHQVGDHYRTSMRSSFASIDQNCAGCHSEHQGRDHNLVAMSQKQCSQCHADLKAVVSGEPKHSISVTGFDQQSHGDFRSLKQDDPGRIRFSHHQHMLPGQVKPGEAGGMTLDRLRAEDRQSYQRTGQSIDQAVQLDCSSCHALAGQEFQRTGDDASSIDQVMLSGNLAPVQFEEHCSACHAISSGSASAFAIELPHAAAWSSLDQILAATIQGDRAMGTATGTNPQTRVRAKIGDGAQRSGRLDAKVTQTELAAARLRIKAQCIECHEPDAVEDDAILAAKTQSSKPMIPKRWLKHGYYDHAAHRQLACQLCHASADPAGLSGDDLQLGFDDSERVMISGIEVCQTCHRAAGTKTPSELAAWDVDLLGGMPTWASDACTLCHRYHTDSNGTPTAPPLANPADVLTRIGPSGEMR